MNVDKIYPHEEVITMEYRFDGNDILKCGLIHKKTNVPGNRSSNELQERFQRICLD